MLANLVPLGVRALLIVVPHELQSGLPVINRHGRSPPRNMADHGVGHVGRREAQARIETGGFEEIAQQITGPRGKAATVFRIVQHLAQQFTVTRRIWRKQGQVQVVLQRAGAPRTETGIRIEEDGPPKTIPLRRPEVLEVLQAPWRQHPIHILTMDLENVVVDVGTHIEIPGEGIVECSRSGGQLEDGVDGSLEGTGRTVKGHPLVVQVHALLAPSEVVLDELLIGLFPSPVDSPILSVEVHLHRTPCRGHGIGLQGQLSEEGVLDLVLPRGLSTVPEIEVSEFGDPGLGSKHRMLQGSRIMRLEIQPERTLGLGTRPTAMNFEVESGFRHRNARCVEPLQPADLRPRLPEVGPHVRIVRPSVRPHHIDARLPIPEVVGMGGNAHRLEVGSGLPDEIGPVHSLTRQMALTEGPNAQDGRFTRGPQPGVHR